MENGNNDVLRDNIKPSETVCEPSHGGVQNETVSGENNTVGGTYAPSQTAEPQGSVPPVTEQGGEPKENNGYYPYNGNGRPYQGGYNYPPQGSYYRPYGGYGYSPYGQYGQNGGYGQPAPGFIGAPYGYYETPEQIKQREDKRNMRKTGNGIGLPLCLFGIVSYIMVLLIRTFMTAFLGESTTVLFLQDSNIIYLLNTAISLVCFTLPFLIVPKMTGVKWSEAVKFKKVSSSKAAPVIMLGMGICALGNYASSLVSQRLEELTGRGSQTAMTDYGTGWMSVVISLLCVGIMPALLEEFAFRGVVLGTLRKRMSDGTAIFVSAALFGLIHGNLRQIPFAFGVGLALGFATVYCDSILPAVILHALNNTFSVLMDYASGLMNPLNSQIAYLLYMAVLLLIGLCGFIMLAKSDNKVFILSDENREQSRQNVAWFSSSPAVIVFCVITVIEVICVQFPEILA